MSIDFSLGEEADAIAQTLKRFARDQAGGAVVPCARFSPDLWRKLCGLEIFSLTGAKEIVAVMEALGKTNFPGPLATTFAAAQLFEGDDRARIVSGEMLVAMGELHGDGLFPWAAIAQRFVWCERDRAFAARAISIEPVETLGCEPWGKVRLERESEFRHAGRALAIADIALGAYLAQAGRYLVEAASEHAKTRTQFGRPIGDYQAVAHALARCATELAAAAALTRVAAHSFDAERKNCRVTSAAAKVSAGKAANSASQVVHQVFGAFGVTEEGPVFPVARRIRQLTLTPGADATARAHLLEHVGLIRSESV